MQHAHGADQTGPQKKLRIIDFGTMVAGPFVSTLLAELDGLATKDDDSYVLTIGATNLPEMDSGLGTCDAYVIVAVRIHNIYIL